MNNNSFYTPKGSLVFYSGEPLDVVSSICNDATERLDRGQKLGIIANSEYANTYRVVLGRFLSKVDTSRNVGTTMHWTQDMYGRWVEEPDKAEDRLDRYAGNLRLEILNIDESPETASAALFDALEKADSGEDCMILAECFSSDVPHFNAVREAVANAGFATRKV